MKNITRKKRDTEEKRANRKKIDKYAYLRENTISFKKGHDGAFYPIGISKQKAKAIVEEY